MPLNISGNAVRRVAAQANNLHPNEPAIMPDPVPSDPIVPSIILNPTGPPVATNDDDDDPSPPPHLPNYSLQLHGLRRGNICPFCLDPVLDDKDKTTVDGCQHECHFNCLWRNCQLGMNPDMCPQCRSLSRFAFNQDNTYIIAGSSPRITITTHEFTWDNVPIEYNEPMSVVMNE